ncbi:MAG TPA: glucose dehydrogenase, partial [Planctomycetia bacterium]|nr:glucose dehydrogenase [Planctomycetia bacterium]
SAPELEGAFMYGDLATGQVYALWVDEATKKATANRLVLEKGTPIFTFGEDDDGETYFSTQEGGIYKFESP